MKLDYLLGIILVTAEVFVYHLNGLYLYALIAESFFSAMYGILLLQHIQSRHFHGAPEEPQFCILYCTRWFS